MSDKLDILKETGAFLEGHFLLSSGRHSNAYCQMAKLQQYPDKAAQAMGGIVYAYEIGRQIGRRAIFTERVDNVMTLRRGFEIHAGERCVIMEDVVTTGKSSLETAKIIEEHGGVVVGIACVVDRSKGASPLPVVASALQLDLPNWAPEECPVCAGGRLPLVKPGSRKMAMK